MAKLVKDRFKKCCLLNDLKDGEMGIIANNESVFYGTIVVKVYNSDKVQILGYGRGTFDTELINNTLRIRKLKPGELIEV